MHVVATWTSQSSSLASTSTTTGQCLAGDRISINRHASCNGRRKWPNSFTGFSLRPGRGISRRTIKNLCGTGISIVLTKPDRVHCTSVVSLLVRRKDAATTRPRDDRFSHKYLRRSWVVYIFDFPQATIALSSQSIHQGVQHVARGLRPYRYTLSESCCARDASQVGSGWRSSRRLHARRSDPVYM
jgi:hypothetical protein